MFDVGDSPLLTIGDCALKTRVNEWPLKLYARLFTFFSQNSQKKHDRLLFSVAEHVFSLAVCTVRDVCSSYRQCSPVWPTMLDMHSVTLELELE